MPSSNRRALLTGTAAVLTAVSGCAGLRSSPNSTEEAPDPHWVYMYLTDREETHHVVVTITNQGGDVLFEKEYELSDRNEADEDATFPASSDPETVVVTVDGTRFERDWPGFERPALPCDGPNEAGIEIYVENARDGRPEVRLEADCQSVTG
mgnify:FL=1